MDNRNGVNETLSLIEAIDLPHPSSALLSSFVKEALHPALAARYVNARLSAGDARSLVSDWVYVVQSISQAGRPPPPPDANTRKTITRRDGNRCCITGKAGTIWDPLIVTPILPVPSCWISEKPQIFEMLGAFFGPPYRDWWLSYARTPEHMAPYHNHWLVRKSAARAFAQGCVKLDRRQPSMIEYEVKPVVIGLEDPIEVDGSYPLLGDHSRAGIQTVDARFIGTQARLCTSFRFVDIAKEIAPEILSCEPPGPLATSASDLSTRRLAKSPTQPGTQSNSLMNLRTYTFFFAWRLLPTSVRVAAYNVLRKLGKMIYGSPDDTAPVQQLPFGLYLKYQGDTDMTRNEFNALQLVHQHTSIPAPQPLDLIPQFNDSSYLLISRVPGIPLWRCQHILSDTDLDDLATQMKDYLTQLRAIPNTANRDGIAICNTLGGPCQDHRIRSGDPIGPFADEAAFSQCLRFSDGPSRRGHRIVFTHADLNPRNILVDRVPGSTRWRVTGIVDWETAGYFPEYWDYTKALFEGFRWTRRYRDLVKRVFDEFGGYEAELEVETRSWEAGDGV